MKKIIYTLLAGVTALSLAACQSTTQTGDVPVPPTESVYFVSGSAKLSPMGEEKVRAFMNEHASQQFDAGYMVYLTAYSDTTGDLTGNEQMADRRLCSVKKVMTDMGIAPWRIRGHFAGVDESTSTFDVRARRVEMSFKPKD